MDYILKRSTRRSIGLKINQEGKLEVFAPYLVTKKRIEDFINSKSNWIEKNINKQKEINEKSKDKISDKEIKELREKAKIIIPQKVEYFSKIIRVDYGKITIRKEKGKWGSCKSNKDLNFNLLLCLLPEEILDSVIIHELCHIKYMNHSKAFYNEVKKYCSNYDECNKWLKENGPIIIRKSIKNNPQ